MEYNHREIEKNWQEYWQKEGFYKGEDFSKKKKKYILIEFPYPSGAGLHVGHARSYSALDAIARKKRMEGYNVLFPIGWDAFGLPTENYALKTGVHPSVATAKNIENFKRQLKSLGLSFDWSREINTTDPKYYKWTQWIFLKLFEKGLAYQAEIPINWCPSCKIGLANEEVLEGECERCHTKTGKKTIKQWMLKITAYADRLIDDLGSVDYPEKVKSQQKNWIGRSYGTEIDFKVEGSSKIIKVFTTRVDTIFGVTAVVLAPEHALAQELITKENEGKAKEYIAAARGKSDFEREKAGKKKTGVFTGSYCLNPVNSKKVPIWIGDYVLASYGGGAVMVVPAHDRRDYDFAKIYKLPIVKVIVPPEVMSHPFQRSAGIWGKSESDLESECWEGEGKLINSDQFDGLSSEDAIEKINQWVEKDNSGGKATHYKFRDWVFSRQHYWGEPIPIIHCQRCGTVAVPEKDLPIELPYIEKYQPTGTGESPLAVIKEWVNTKCPKCGGPAKRETDTMPNWAGSNWYYMRYTDAHNDKSLADRKKLDYWMPIDWYNGGFEHTTLHLLYSRFIYKFLFDIGVAPQSEPYKKRTSHGIVLAEDGRKMSKSFGNVINPDEIVEKYGADTLRLYEMFMGPFEQAISWSASGVRGVWRFIERLISLFEETLGKKNSSKEILSAVNKLNKKVDGDLESMKFNTSVAGFMEFLNLCIEKKKDVGRDAIERFLLLLAPFAPHIAEELWRKLGNQKSIFGQDWPHYDSKIIKEKFVTMIVQVDGKVRDKIRITPEISEKKAKEIALSSPRVKKWIKGKEVKKVISVIPKLINIVVK
ncbi:MAG: leucine--tRNA ligase [Patescibacteria group bacterium]